MRFLHIADLHADAPMEANLPSEKASLRRSELILAFTQAVEKAEQADAKAVLIAGDLFDGAHPSPLCRSQIFSVMESHPKLDFLWLSGNHDRESTYLPGLTANIKTFPYDRYGVYEYENVRIFGCEDCTLPPPMFPSETINLVMLHGEAAESAGEGKIDLRLFKGKNVDCLVLGHYHSYTVGKLDLRGSIIYAGCPAGRGFDECGAKGCVLYEIEKNTVSPVFVPIDGRQFHAVTVDLTGAKTLAEIQSRLFSAVAEIENRDAVKIMLTGKVPASLHISEYLFAALLSERFWFAKVKDKTCLQLPKEDFSLDVSLKGAFIRAVIKGETDPELRDRIILYGMRALDGQKPEEDGR